MGVFAGPEIVEDGLVLVLDAGNTKSYPGSGTTWTDLSGNGNNGTLTNMDGANLDSANGGSLTFDGTNEYIQLTTTTLSSTSSTISSWINVTDFITGKPSGTGRVFIMNSSATFLNMIAFYNGGYSFETNTNSNPHEIAGRTTGNVSSSAISPGSWFHFSLVFDSNTFYGYVNGIQTGTAPISDNLIFNRIGYDTNRDNYPAYFKGKISNFKIYNKALTAQEIQQNFNATRSRFNI